MTKHINIDELFLRLWNGDYDKSYEKTLEETKQALYDLISNEIIGEDETNGQIESKTIKELLPMRNKLRQEQRQKLNDLFKGDKE